MTTATAPAKRGRPSAADDLRLELRAAGLDMRAAGHHLLYADRTGRRDLTLHTAAQLISRGERYARS